MLVVGLTAYHLQRAAEREDVIIRVVLVEQSNAVKPTTLRVLLLEEHSDVLENGLAAGA